jgi:predicted DNA binding CopG/RHH family protein
MSWLREKGEVKGLDRVFTSNQIIDRDRPRDNRKMRKKIPEFRNNGEEFEFWSKNDSTEYVDWSKAQRVKLPNLKPALRTISVRLRVAMVEDLKVLANQRDVPYQSLLKIFLAERLEQERMKRKVG